MSEHAMPLTANPVVKNKYWIVEHNGKKVATIQSTTCGVVYVHENKREPFPSIKLLCNKYDITVNKHPPVKHPKTSSFDGYPCDVVPCNPMYDVPKKLPIYTKDETSKSYFCAGYYLLKVRDQWVPEYCPKLILMSRSPYLGPFRTMEEMNSAKEQQ